MRAGSTPGADGSISDVVVWKLASVHVKLPISARIGFVSDDENGVHVPPREVREVDPLPALGPIVSVSLTMTPASPVNAPCLS